MDERRHFADTRSDNQQLNVKGNLRLCVIGTMEWNFNRYNWISSFIWAILYKLWGFIAAGKTYWKVRENVYDHCEFSLLRFIGHRKWKISDCNIDYGCTAGTCIKGGCVRIETTLEVRSPSDKRKFDSTMQKVKHLQYGTNFYSNKFNFMVNLITLRLPLFL